MSATSKLDEAIAAVCPLLSIERIGEEFLWNVVFAPEATSEQISAANAIIAGFDGEAVEAQEAAEAVSLNEVFADVRSDALFAQIKSSSAEEISTLVNTQFAGFTDDQRQVIELLLKIASLV